MSAFSLALAALSLGSTVRAQQAGTLTAEKHPSLSVSTCTSSGCTSKAQTVVLDANWRWLHSTSGSTNCYTGNEWNKDLCPDAETCAQNCALDGADYPGTYGIKTSGSQLSLQLKTGSNVGSRVYLMDQQDKNYQMFNLLNKEFTFDVDVSTLGCGLNGALYFVSMPEDGGASSTNKAGTKYGTGYCDAQCARDLKFVGGVANSESWDPSSANSGVGGIGSCCSEMDIWEANSISNALTPHVCTPNNAPCTTDADCSSGDGNRYKGFCDADGCDINPYRMGNTSFYGPGKTVDTKKPMTVVTQFITSDGTDTGDLVEIRRLYVQNGKVYQQPNSNVAGIDGNVISDKFCTQQKSVFGDTNYFATKGGIKAMGNSFKNGGMVLVMSLWDDYSANMLWLDGPWPRNADTSKPGVVRGSCSASSGKPEDVESQQGSATVVFSNIKTGPIGSTYSGALQPGGGNNGGGSGTSTTRTSTTTSRTSTTTSRVTTTTLTRTTTTTTSSRTTTQSPAGSAAPKYAQCGGIGWQGPTTCVSGTTCTKLNDYYSQCL